MLEGAPYLTGAGGRISWVADGRHLVIDGQAQGRPGNHLSLIDIDSGSIPPLTFGTSEEVSPAASPSGGHIAFVSGTDDSDVTNARGSPEIWVRSLREGWTTPVVTRDSAGPDEWQNVARPAVSPDGQRIAYDIVGATHGIWVSPIAGGRGVLLDPVSDDQHSPSWSPDARWIAYQRLVQGKWELAKIPSSGGTAVRLADGNPGGGPQTAWSPTGEWIAYVRPGSLRVVSADGNSDRELMSSLAPAFGFSRDGMLLHAFGRGSNGWELATVEATTGKQRAPANPKVPTGATFAGFSLRQGNCFSKRPSPSTKLRVHLKPPAPVDITIVVNP